MNRSIFHQLMHDEAGFILSAELVVVSTVVVLGLISGLVCIKSAVVGELKDVGEAVGSLNQSYYYSGMSGCRSTWCGIHSQTAGSDFIDYEDGGSAEVVELFIPTHLYLEEADAEGSNDLNESELLKQKKKLETQKKRLENLRRRLEEKIRSQKAEPIIPSTVVPVPPLFVPNGVNQFPEGIPCPPGTIIESEAVPVPGNYLPEGEVILPITPFPAGGCPTGDCNH